jgi:signal transduction histidine kinase
MLPQDATAQARHNTTSGLNRLATLFALVMLGVSAFTVWQSWQAVQAEQVQQLSTVLELVQKATDRYFVQTQASLAGLEAEINEGGGLADLARAQRLLRRFHGGRPELAAVNLVATNGAMLATSTTARLDGLPSTAALRDYTAIMASLRPDAPMELSRPFLGPLSQRWILPMRYTVRDAGGQAVAFLVAAAPVDLLQTFWRDAPIATRVSISLARDDGYLLSRYPKPPGLSDAALYGQPQPVPPRDRQQPGWALRGHESGQARDHAVLTDAHSVTLLMRLAHFPVTLAVAMPRSELQAAWWRRSWESLALLLPLGLGAALAYFLLLRRQRGWDAERQRAEDLLRASEAQLDRTGRLARVGGWQMDLASNTIHWSPQTRRIHEVADDYQPTLDAVIRFYAPGAQAELQAAVQAGQRDGKPWDLELPFTTALGRSIWVRALGEVERQGGKPTRLIGAIQDVTDYREQRVALDQERALRQQAEQQAEALNALLQERSQMLDVLAHEVRQPLHNASAALQSAGLVLADINDTRASLRLTRARAVLSQVLSSIDNTLAVAALLARPGPIALEDTDIETLVAVVAGDIPADQRARVQVEKLSATRTAAMDMSLVRLALRNLVLNALKYSPDGTPVLVRVADSDAPLALLIDVVDQGPGMAPGLLPRLFQRGARGGSSSGHGLGLYIVRRVMELHHGHALLQHSGSDGVTMRLMFDQASEPAPHAGPAGPAAPTAAPPAAP